MVRSSFLSTSSFFAKYLSDKKAVKILDENKIGKLFFGMFMLLASLEISLFTHFILGCILKIPIIFFPFQVIQNLYPFPFQPPPWILGVLFSMRAIFEKIQENFLEKSM